MCSIAFAAYYTTKEGGSGLGIAKKSREAINRQPAVPSSELDSESRHDRDGDLAGRGPRNARQKLADPGRMAMLRQRAAGAARRDIDGTSNAASMQEKRRKSLRLMARSSRRARRFQS